MAQEKNFQSGSIDRSVSFMLWKLRHSCARYIPFVIKMRGTWRSSHLSLSMKDHALLVNLFFKESDRAVAAVKKIC